MFKIIALTGKARSGKTTFAAIAESKGYVPVDISKFLARMTSARLGLSSCYSLEEIDARKDEISIGGRSLRQHIIETGNALDYFLPTWVISEMLRLGKSHFIIPSVKHDDQVQAIRELLPAESKLVTVKIVRPSQQGIADVRTEVKADVIVYNDSGLVEFEFVCNDVTTRVAEILFNR